MSVSAPPGWCAVAFKEWAGVCDALLQGRQAIIIRKGGISEGPGPGVFVPVGASNPRGVVADRALLQHQLPALTLLERRSLVVRLALRSVILARSRARRYGRE